MPGPVERWLETFMCKQYADTFEAYGFKTLQSVCQLQLPQLQAMGVAQEHCEKILENVHVLRQTLLGPMNHYSDDIGGGYGPNPHRMSNMGGYPTPDNPAMVGMPPNMSGYPSHHPQSGAYGEQPPPAHMMMPQQSPYSSHSSGMYNPSSQQQQFMGQPFMHPYPGSPYSGRTGGGGGGGGGSLPHPSYGNMMGGSQMYQPGTQTSPRHHHLRQTTSAQTPQEVANNILQMAASSYSGHQTVQVPLSKHRTAPYHVPNSPHYNMQPQQQQTMQHQPGSPTLAMMGGHGQFVYPNSSPHHQQQARTSPISPMLMHSPVSHHSNQSLPNSSPGSLHSPAQGSVKSPVPTPSPSMGGLRSPCAMQSMSSPMRSSSRSMRSPPLNQQLHVSVPSSHASQICGGGGGGMQSPAQQHSAHYSPSHNPLNSPLSHQGSPYPSTPQNAVSSPQTRMYQSPPSSSSTSYINSLYSQEPNHMSSSAGSSNPLQSLQKLCMLPETQVIDPKSIVNDACLPSPQNNENSKNCEGGANLQKAGSSCGSSDNSVSGCGSASVCSSSMPVSSQCMDGKHCDQGFTEVTDNLEVNKDVGHCSPEKAECLNNNSCTMNGQENSIRKLPTNRFENNEDKPLSNGDIVQIGNSLSPKLRQKSGKKEKRKLRKENVSIHGARSDQSEVEHVKTKKCKKFNTNIQKQVKTWPGSPETDGRMNSNIESVPPLVNGDASHHEEEDIKFLVNGPPHEDLNCRNETCRTENEHVMNCNTETLTEQQKPVESVQFQTNKHGFEEFASQDQLSLENFRYAAGNQTKASTRNKKSRRNGPHLQNNRKKPSYDIDDGIELETLKVRKDCRNTYSRHTRGVLIPAGVSGQECLGSLQSFSGSSDDEDWASTPVIGYSRIHKRERKFLSRSPLESEFSDNNNMNNISSRHEQSFQQALSTGKSENSLYASPSKGGSREQSVSSTDGEITQPVNPQQKSRGDKSSPPVSSNPSSSPPGRTRQKQGEKAVLCDRQQGKKNVQEPKYTSDDGMNWDCSGRNGSSVVDVDLDPSIEDALGKDKSNDDDNDGDDDDSSDDSEDDKALITYKSKEKFPEPSPERIEKETESIETPNSQTRNSRMQTRRKRHRSSWSRYEENFFKGDFIFDDEEDCENMQVRKKTKKSLAVSEKPVTETVPEKDDIDIAVQPHYSPISDAVESDQENVELDMELDSEEIKPVKAEPSFIENSYDLDSVDAPPVCEEVKSETLISENASEFLSPDSSHKKRGRPVGSKNKIKKLKSDKHKVRGKHGKSKGKVRDTLGSDHDSFSAMKLKKTLDLMKTKKKKMLSVGSLPGPHIKIEGSRRHPTSCVIVNQPQEVKPSDPKMSKKKKSSAPAQSVHISKLPSEKSVVVPGNRVLEEAVWVCALCGKHSSYKFLGDLFGPYYVEGQLPEIKVEEQPTAESSSSKKKKSLPPASSADKVTKGRKSGGERRSGGGKTSSSAPDSDLNTEVWIHEDCVVWADGVYLIGQKIFGLQEAKRIAKATNCSYCKESGAMVGCLHKGCSQKYHFVCAIEKGCYLDEENFSLLCLKHKDKKLKGPIPSGIVS